MLNIFKIRGNKNITALMISILISEGVGVLSVAFSGGNMRGFFGSLYKPIFTPSACFFSVVWVILYFLMGVSAYRIWFLGKRGLNVRKPLTLYILQLILNFVWSIIFFRFNLLWIAFLEIMALFVFIMVTILEFRRFDKIAFYLMIPYVVCVAFAIMLSYSLWMLN